MCETRNQFAHSANAKQNVFVARVPVRCPPGPRRFTATDHGERLADSRPPHTARTGTSSPSHTRHGPSSWRSSRSASSSESGERSRAAHGQISHSAPLLLTSARNPTTPPCAGPATRPLLLMTPRTPLRWPAGPSAGSRGPRPSSPPPSPCLPPWRASWWAWRPGARGSRCATTLPVSDGAMALLWAHGSVPPSSLTARNPKRIPRRRLRPVHGRVPDAARPDQCAGLHAPDLAGAGLWRRRRVRVPRLQLAQRHQRPRP